MVVAADPEVGQGLDSGGSGADRVRVDGHQVEHQLRLGHGKLRRLFGDLKKVCTIIG